MLVWLAAVAATMELRPFLRSLQRPICALPIALVALSALGPVVGRVMGRASACAEPTAKRLLPFLFYHFERSTRGM
jgi:hypothetical protein